MHARVTHFRILPGKVGDFRQAVDSVIPKIRLQQGFRAMVVLKTEEGTRPEATIVSVWDSFDDLKASEKNLFLYQAISRLLAHCDGFPTIREHEVLVSEFAVD
jgi:heme-degrading monooxygenase HmoA